MERKETVKMWEARHYKARLEAKTTLKMSGCVPPLAMLLLQNVQLFYMSRSTPYIEELRGL